MESNTKSQKQKIFEKNTEDIDAFNNFMNTLFSEISKKKLSFLKDTKLKKEDIIKNMENNSKLLFNFIIKLDENQNKEIYQCLSCIFGAFLGDSIGAYCEFRGADYNNCNKIYKGNPIFGDQVGQVTDDSEMAMSNGFSLMDNPYLEEVNADFCYYYYGLWHVSKPRDEGITTRKALKSFQAKEFNPEKKNNYEKDFQKIKQSNSNSLANGFLMRTSPFIVWCYFRFKNKILSTLETNNPNPKDLFSLFEIIKNEARKDDICTHPNDSLPVSHSIFCIMALGAICKLEPAQIVNIIEILLQNDYFQKSQDKKITDIKDMIMNELNYYKNDGKKILIQTQSSYTYFTSGTNNVNSHMGFYFHAFRLTLYYLYFFNEIKEEKKFNKIRTIMNQICNFGGDTDTNAAIVGTVIGPLIGYKNFGGEFEKMVTLIPKNRFIYSPFFMIIYVYFIKDNIDNKGKLNYNFLKMFLTATFDKIDVNHINNIFTKFN